MNAEGSVRTWDNQCFTYDAMGELVNAWTSSIAPPALTQTETGGKGCKSASGAIWGHRPDGAPSSGPVADAPHQAGTTAPANLASTAPDTVTVATGTTAYRQSFTFDWLGNRATMTDHAPSGNTSYTYTYSATQPHTLLSAASSTTGKSSSYTYNSTGTTKTRDLPGTTPDQTLEWTNEQRLESNTAGGVKTTYVYDADGNRVLENSPTGSTLYLGETELTTNGTTITRASRAYGQAGAPTVVRTTTNSATTGHTLAVLIADHLGTANTSVAVATGQAVTRRAFKPYGELRGPKPTTWPNKRSYLGVGIDDTTTGLTHIGAREYDQNTGRFLSADPIIDFTDPLQMNGYTYANNSPVSYSDPTGLFLDDFLDSAGDALKGAYHGAVDWTSKTAEGWNLLTGDTEEANKIRVDRENPGPFSGTRFLKDLGGQPAPYSPTYRASYWLTQFMMPILPGAGMAVSAAARGAAKAPAASKAISKAAPAVLGKGENVAPRVLPDCHSFLPQTEVLMADGARKKIEAVEVGDVVVTTDVETGKEAEKKVLETIRTEDDKDFTKITIATGDTLSSIVATDTHPFWVPALKEWVRAGDLSTGQWLRTSAGTLVQITALEHYTKRQRTHDLTIQDIHAYYVLADATPVLVHNCNGKLVSNGTAASATVTPQSLLDDAKALHDTFGVGTRADRGTTVATGQLGGELVYSVANNGTNRKLKALAKQLGYRRVYENDLTPQVHSDAEQILFNAIDEAEYAGDGIIASSRPACGPARQNCRARANDYPGVQLWDRSR